MTIHELIGKLGRYADEHPLGGDAPVVIELSDENYDDPMVYRDNDGNIVIC